MKSLRILTFNHHEPYLCALAEVGHQWDVVVRYKTLNLKWHEHSHPKPKNMTLVEFDHHIESQLRNNQYDLVVCHTLKNLLWLFRFRSARFVFVGHIPLFQNSWTMRIKSRAKRLAWQLFAWTHRAWFVGVSRFKLESWGVKGRVIVLAPQPFPPLPATTDSTGVVIVGNHLKERGMEMGWPVLEQVLSAMPIKVIGDNPSISGSIKPKNFDEFLKHFQSGGIYLFTVPYPFGDGYNTAMLEAMSMGMAVVTLFNPTSPIEHGVNGLVGRDAESLIASIQLLQKDPALLTRLGNAARATIETKFSRQSFIDGWRQVIETATTS